MSRQILAIDANGLDYRDEDSTQKRIDFEACYQNYLARVLAPDHWERIKSYNGLTDADWENHVERTKSWKEVAARDITGWSKFDKPYIEFHTEPPTYFEFDNAEAFHQVTWAVGKHGWMTFDRS